MDTTTETVEQLIVRLVCECDRHKQIDGSPDAFYRAHRKDTR